MSDPLALAKHRLTVGLDSEPPKFEPLTADQWVVKSLLQKSIRRGEVEIRATSRAHVLGAKRLRDMASLYCHSIEDIGAGSADVVPKPSRRVRIQAGGSNRAETL